MEVGGEKEGERECEHRVRGRLPHSMIPGERAEDETDPELQEESVQGKIKEAAMQTNLFRTVTHRGSSHLSSSIAL